MKYYLFLTFERLFEIKIVILLSWIQIRIDQILWIRIRIRPMRIRITGFFSAKVSGHSEPERPDKNPR